MELLGIFLKPVFYIVDLVLRLYVFIIVIQVIMSWLMAFQIINTRNQFIVLVNEVLYRLTEPVLGPIRRRLPPTGAIDFSPLVLILGILFLRMMFHSLAIYLFQTL